ncbi:hypothetical protein ACWEKT_07325 [Nocardia takedensis]
MSDHSVEDAMRGQMRQFSAAMRAAMAHHAQAGNWLERRKARKEISRLIRAEHRDQDVLRRNQLTYTNQAVDRYRAYANTVAQRANDPRVDHHRRAADAAGLSEQRDRLAAMFVGNAHLTPVERGIALDGLDAATVFPEFKTGNLFARASRVKGIEALHYRARLAREVTAMRGRPSLAAEQQRATAPRSVDQRSERERVEDALWAKARQERDEQARLDRIEAGAPEPNRYRATVASTDANGVTASKSESFGTEYAATRWMRGNPDRMLSSGERVHVQTWDSHDATAPLYSHSGRQRAVMASLTGREQALARETLRQADERAPWQSDTDRGARPGAEVAAERDSLKTRLDLSIEHNGELTDRNGDLTRRLTATVAERDQQAVRLRDALAERDRLRAERDEAVQQLARQTPAAQRYGSPERQAEAAKQAARDPWTSRTAPRGPQLWSEEPRGPVVGGEPDPRSVGAQEYDALVGRNVAMTLDAGAPDVAWQHLADVNWHQVAKGSDDLGELTAWWAREGAADYWQRHPVPESGRRPQAAEYAEVHRLRSEIDQIGAERATVRSGGRTAAPESERAQESEPAPEPAPSTEHTAEREYEPAGWGSSFAEVAADFQSGRNGHDHDREH